MDFSIILNSRGRPQMLFGLIDSIFSTTEDPANTQVLIYVDEDDVDTLNVLGLIEVNFKNVDMTIGPRPYNLHQTMNMLADKSSGSFLFALNDDVVFLTEGWDKIITEAAEQAFSNNGDKILYIGTADTSVDKVNHKKYSSFPIITKQAKEALGYFVPENFVGLGADVYLYRVFDKLNRVLSIEDIVLDHVFHTTVEKVMNPDLTCLEMRSRTYSNPIDPWSIDIEEDVSKVNEKTFSSL